MSKGVMFFATPHFGMDGKSWSEFATFVLRLNAPIPGISPTKRMLKDIAMNSHVFLSITEDFVPLQAGLVFVNFTEGKIMQGLEHFLVDAGRGWMNAPNKRQDTLEGDHMGICKFGRDQSDSAAFAAVCDGIRYLIEESPKAIGSSYVTGENNKLPDKQNMERTPSVAPPVDENKPEVSDGDIVMEDAPVIGQAAPAIPTLSAHPNGTSTPQRRSPSPENEAALSKQGGRRGSSRPSEEDELAERVSIADPGVSEQVHIEAFKEVTRQMEYIPSYAEPEVNPQARDKEPDHISTLNMVNNIERLRKTADDYPPGNHAGSSQAGGSSKLDSGYESTDNASKGISDNQTLYSIDSILSEPKGIYIKEFARGLADDIHKILPFSELPEGFYELLPGLLTTFTRKLHGESSTKIQREASVFLHKNVAEAMGSIPLCEPSEQSSGDQEEQKHRQPFRRPASDVGDWVSSLPDADVSGNLDAPGDLEVLADLEVPGDLQASLADYQQFIQKSQAYGWLLSMIKGHSQLEIPNRNQMVGIGESIRNQILVHAPFREVSRQRAPVSIQMSFSLDWDPLRFIQDQEYSIPPTEVLDHIICLTGSWRQAQALTTSEYIEQTWPLTHQPIQSLLKKLLSLSMSTTYDFDGASALLHLVRASIDQDRIKPAYSSKWKFNSTLEGDSSPRGGGMAAIEVLGNPDNLNLKLYLDDKKPNESGNLVEIFYYFRDRVQEILHNLQILIDYQAQIAAQDGYWFPQSGNILKKSVVGFDFWDVTSTGPIRQRVYYLSTVGYGWVDYIRSIKATTIFGKKFGELLQAESQYLLCRSWKTVPVRKDFMGASIATLKKIQKAKKETALSPGEITSDILWSSRRNLFSQCECLAPHSDNTVSHFNPVQLLLPKGQKMHLDVPKMCVNITLDDLGDNGAVIFGHTPFRIGPRQKEEKPSGQEEGETTGAPTVGSSRSQGMFSHSAVNDAGLSTSSTSTQITQPSSGTGVSGDTMGSSFRDKEKKRWRYLRIFRSKK
ncbi:hypothetical protein DL765_011216 [Monosporascus sp. GIB2]|nr:hypothetical protein DL765_011216 [Monosporascus sp. GIB2]